MADRSSCRGVFVKIARPAQRTLDELPTLVKVPTERENARKRRPSKRPSHDRKDREILELFSSYEISEDDSGHILECLGVSCVADLVDIESEDLAILNLEPNVETILNRLVLDTKRKAVGGKKSKLSPTSVVNVATKRSKRNLSNVRSEEESELSPIKKSCSELLTESAESSPSKPEAAGCAFKMSAP